MSKKIFVGGLAWATTNDSLRAAFEPFGTVVDAVVILDRETGKSRGFGFVSFETEEIANTACEAMNGKEIDGRAVRINTAEDLPKKSFSDKKNFRNNRTPSQDAKSREPKSAPSENKRSYADIPAFDFPSNDAGSKRDNRRKDRKKRDRFDDDDRW